MPKFKLKDHGSWLTKGGGGARNVAECVGIILANDDPRPLFIELVKQEVFMTTSRICDLSSRTHESYIFAGPVGPRGGKRKLYWPRVSSLEKVKIY